MQVREGLSVPAAFLVLAVLCGTRTHAAVLQEEGAPPSAEFLELLRAAAGPDAALQLEQRTAELVHAPRAVESFLAVRAAGALAQADVAPPEALSPEQALLLERASRAFDARDVVGFLERRARDAVDVEWRRAALELLGWHGTSAELGLLLALVLDDDDAPPSDTGLLEAFRASMIEIGRRDSGLTAEVERSSLAIDPVRATLIRALGNAGDPVALPWLADQLDDQELTAAALQEIGRLAACSHTRSEEVAARVRPFIHAEDVALRRHAMRAVASLRDEASVPHLAAILHVGNASEQKSALAALRQLTGRELPGDAAVWWAWYRAEQTWLVEQLPAVLAQLPEGSEAQVITAVRALSERGLERERLALELLPLLDHASSAVRAQVCLALARLGSTEVLDELMAAMDDEEPSVRDGAWRALGSLTGLDLPPETETWRAALDERG